MNLKRLKAELKKKTDKEPEKYYAVSVLKERGFHRTHCKNCGKYFWTMTESELCGEPECSGGYTFIGNSPTSKTFDFIQTWKEFAKLFEKLGYEPINRYPVVARWRDDVYWTNASIYDFQPHVVSGAVEPPANPLVVPQACVRFNDIDNVGITGRHYTSFVMIGQHAFVEPKKFELDTYFSDIVEWLEKGMGLPLHEVKFHEDQWGGGGNLGVCMEFFSRGLEIGNQVYINYEVTDNGYKDLPLRILDMGMGQERPAWITHGTETSYEANFPTVAKELYRLTGVRPRPDVWKRFLPYSGLLNMDEVDDIEKVWGKIGKELGMDSKELKEEILPVSALYSIGDHTRTLLFAISDGAIPSNVGGCYNLRILLRRALSYIDQYDWNVSLIEMCQLHSQYLKPQYPELEENLEEVAEILSVEEERYNKSKGKSQALVQRIVKEGVSEGKLVELYDSQGIAPEFLQEEAKKIGKTIKIPADFYAKVAARHPDVEKEAKKKEKIDVEGLPATVKLYYDSPHDFEFKAKVLKVIGKDKVVLDQTAFYPTGGGQLNDLGTLVGKKVLDVK